MAKKKSADSEAYLQHDGIARVAAVWTRSLESAESYGRPRTLRLIRRALNENFRLTEFSLLSALERHGRTAWITLILRLARAWIRGELMPLQCLLFGSKEELWEMAHSIVEGKFDAVYVDSIRTAPLVSELRALGFDGRVIMDMDDLMSLRMAEWRRLRLSVKPGYLSSFLPAACSWLLDWASWLILRYEEHSLRIAERKVLQHADAVTLVSSADASVLRTQFAGEQSATVIVLPPSIEFIRAAQAVSSPVRFIFVGSDKLHQNALTIDYLLRVWRRVRPSAQLHIIGTQGRVCGDIPNVIWHGYVPDLSAVYDSHSVMICPSFVRGGLKTKIIEAFAHGSPVLGNTIAFEALTVAGDYPLRIDDEAALEEIISSPDNYLDRFMRAAKLGSEFVKRHLAYESFSAGWRRAVWPSTEAQHCESIAAVAEDAVGNTDSAIRNRAAVT